MTIYVDPYHTTAGVIIDTSRVVTPLKESTIRDSLTGTNLGVRASNDIVPVFITGCRDSEKVVPPFAHSIFIKNFNKKSYLFTDMTLFVRSGGSLEDISKHIRRQEEFEFTKARAIASLAWCAGEYERFQGSMAFAGEVFAAWMGQTLSRSFALDFMATHKVQMIALAYWDSLFKDGPVIMADDEDACMVASQKAMRAWRIPVPQAMSFYRSIDLPMASIADFCAVVVKMLDNVNLNPVPGQDGSGFNTRVLLNLIADAWYSTNSKQILATALEHPPTMCAIIYYCANYNNFRRQQLGQTIQSVGKGGKGDSFTKAFARLLEDYNRPDVRMVSVMEYLDPNTFNTDESEVSKLFSELEEQETTAYTKEVNTMESLSTQDQQLLKIWEQVKEPGAATW